MSMRGEIRAFLEAPIPGDLDGLQTYQDECRNWHERARFGLANTKSDYKAAELAELLIDLNDRIAGCYQLLQEEL